MNLRRRSSQCPTCSAPSHRAQTRRDSNAIRLVRAPSARCRRAVGRDRRARPRRRRCSPTQWFDSPVWLRRRLLPSRRRPHRRPSAGAPAHARRAPQVDTAPAARARRVTIGSSCSSNPRARTTTRTPRRKTSRAHHVASVAPRQEPAEVARSSRARTTPRCGILESPVVLHSTLIGGKDRRFRGGAKRG